MKPKDKSDKKVKPQLLNTIPLWIKKFPTKSSKSDTVTINLNLTLPLTDWLSFIELATKRRISIEDAITSTIRTGADVNDMLNTIES